jgi:arylsulfatase A-like enzyme
MSRSILVGVAAVLLGVLVSLCTLPWLCDADALNPRRPPNEAEFWKLGHHERASTDAVMRAKIEEIKKRRKWDAWDLSNPHVQVALETSNKTGTRRPNVLIMLADDLGYGDLSVTPFTSPIEGQFPCGEGGILSPNLERMAANGVVMTSFHSASPVCSPSRVGIMTSLYPWRLGALNAFELGRDMSQRNGFLPQVPTGPEIFREAGYYTAHSGKWHLGGMREEMRVDRAYRDQCHVGSPNQHGFEEYVSELDGPESPRYTFLLRNSILHSQGHRHLLRDDVPVPIYENPPGQQQVLSDREADDAITVMKECKEKRPGQPWMIQVWFNAPHGPWETLYKGEELYPKHYKDRSINLGGHHCSQPYEKLRDSRPWQYRTMVSAMDRSIGRLLDALKELGEEENTIVVFTSDNGPEAGAGTPGPRFKERKRSLMEGGVRVPAIWQWKGVIPAGSVIHDFAGTVDIFPTMLEAADIAKPDNLQWDGLSLLALLKSGHDIERKKHHEHHGHHGHGARRLSEHVGDSNSTQEHDSQNTTVVATVHAGSVSVSQYGKLNQLQNRVFLWHKDTDPATHNGERFQSGGHFDDIKVITTERNGCLLQVYDLRHDPYEDRNLVTGRQQKHNCKIHFNNYNNLRELENIIDRDFSRHHCEKHIEAANAQKTTLESCMTKYHQSVVAKIQVCVCSVITLIERCCNMGSLFAGHHAKASSFCSQRPENSCRLSTAT